jgi:multicomponent Na+:H+ antiporter subunit E
MKPRNPLSTIVSFALLMTFWLVMSGFFDVFHITIGALCVGVVLFLDARLKRARYFDDEVDILATVRYGRGIYFLLWLVWQMIVSGLQVARLILSPHIENQSQVIKFRAHLPNPQAYVILANSITLTPGTLTLELQGDEFTVHALSPSSYAGILDDSMPLQVLRIFTKETHPVVHDVRFLGSEDFR